MIRIKHVSDDQWLLATYVVGVASDGSEEYLPVGDVDWDRQK